MLMKRLLAFTVVISVCIATAIPSFAIEKRKKDVPAPKSDTTTRVKPQPQLKPDNAIDTLKTPIRRRTLPVFNDFIDVNRNGIDDRREQGGYFVPPKQAPKTPAVIKKTDSTKTVLPKPAADKSQKKGK